MQLLSCLLPTALLATGVSAFYPYRVPKSPDSNPKPRFFPYRPATTYSNGEEDSHNGVTLDLVKHARAVRRDSQYHAEMGSEPTMENGLAIHTDGLDFAYFSTVEFGSKNQEMWMLLDTGAPNTWVMGSECTVEACKMHNTFSEEDSTTLTTTDASWIVSYGTGEVRGVVIEDSMSFAGFVLQFPFGAAHWASEEFKSYPMDGILGLGRSNESFAGIPTVMEAIRQKKVLQKNVLGINLQRSSDGHRDGQVILGDIDKSKFEGDITYTNTVPDKSEWEIPLDNVIVGGEPINLENKTAIIDTGTSYILMPRDDANKIHALISGSVPKGKSDFLVPCSADTTLEFVFSGQKFSISPKDYVGTASGSDGMCNSNIVGKEVYGKDRWLVGATFIKNVYVIYDYDESKIGFAKRKYLDIKPTQTASTTQSTSGPTLAPVPPKQNEEAKPETTPSSAEANEPPPSDPTGAASGLSIPMWLSIAFSLSASCSIGFTL